jgi:hypothetical protein
MPPVSVALPIEIPESQVAELCRRWASENYIRRKHILRSLRPLHVAG